MKEYQGEKAIISLTSWRARINTVGKTIFNLYKMCPGFHIVLCLSEEEFPKKEEELPEDLMLMANANIFEILWVYKNYKAYKKVIFTMDKYRDVPVISADDDCIYTCNYAEVLYSEWTKHKTENCIIRWTKNYSQPFGTQGPCSLYSPNKTLKYSTKILSILNDEIIKESLDDDFAANIIKKSGIKIIPLYKKDFPYRFHTITAALHPSQKTTMKKYIL